MARNIRRSARRRGERFDSGDEYTSCTSFGRNASSGFKLYLYNVVNKRLDVEVLDALPHGVCACLLAQVLGVRPRRQHVTDALAHGRGDYLRCCPRNGKRPAELCNLGGQPDVRITIPTIAHRILTDKYEP